MRYLLILLVFISACQSLPDNQVEKLKLLNQALEKGVVDNRESIFSSNRSLRRQIILEGRTLEGLKRLAKLEESFKQTFISNHQIDKIKKIIQDKGSQEAQKLMLGKNKDGLAYALKTTLDQYCHYLLTEFKDVGIDSSVIYPLAEGNKNNPFYANTAAQKLDFAEANFQNTSTEAMLALLTYKQMEVARYQLEVVKKHTAGDLMPEIWLQNQLIFGAQPQSITVNAGETYEANLNLLMLLPTHQTVIWNDMPLPSSFTGVNLGELITDKAGAHSIKVKIGNQSVNIPYYVLPTQKPN